MENRTYSEMLIEAKKIHPSARVRFSYFDTWEIFIPTDFEDSYSVDPSWENTAADKAYNTMSGGGDSELTRWAQKNSSSGYPLQIIAEKYNLVEAREEYIYVHTNDKLLAAGFPTIHEMTRTGEQIPLEQVQAYTKFREEAVQESAEKYGEAFKRLAVVMDDFHG